MIPFQTWLSQQQGRITGWMVWCAALTAAGSKIATETRIAFDDWLATVRHTEWEYEDAWNAAIKWLKYQWEEA